MTAGYVGRGRNMMLDPVFTKMPSVSRGMPMDRTPGGAKFALPRGFKCAMCGTQVKEEYYGQGFKGCGAVQGEEEQPLCLICLDLVTQIVTTGREQMIDILTKAGMSFTLPADEDKRDGV